MDVELCAWNWMLYCLIVLSYNPVCPLYYRKNLYLYCMRDSWIKKKEKKEKRYVSIFSIRVYILHTFLYSPYVSIFSIYMSIFSICVLFPSGNLYFSYVTKEDARMDYDEAIPQSLFYKCNVFNSHLDFSTGGSYSRIIVTEG